MGKSFRRLLLQMVVFQIVAYTAVGIIYGSITWSEYRNSANVLFGSVQNNLLLGDYRQAKTELYQGLNFGFERIEVHHQDLGLLILVEGNNNSTSFSVLKALRVMGDRDANQKISILFMVNLFPLMTKIIGILLSLLFLNFIAVAIFKSRIEELLSSKAESEKMRTIGELALSVAHDLRSPLSLAKVIAAKISQSNSGYGEDLTKVINRIESIATEMLKKHRTNVVTFANLQQILVESVEECRARFGTPAESIALSLNFGDQDATIIGNPNDWRRAFTNLIVNAVESRNTNEHSVKIVGFRSPEGFQIRIEDNGRGIPPDLLRKINRGRFQSWGKPGGTGVGLKGALAIFNQYAATVKISSKLNEGTQIQVLVKM